MLVKLIREVKALKIENLTTLFPSAGKTLVAINEIVTTNSTDVHG